MKTYGISRDSPWSHVAWAQVLDLGDTPLLSDWNGDAVRGFDVELEYRGMTGVAERTAFLVGRRHHPRSMALRDRRGARLRQAALGRPLALVGAVYAAAAVAATWPAITSFGSAFIANDRIGAGEPPAGDHLQSVYRFWLVGHQLGHGRAPWKDPYSFQPIVEPQTVLGGWPFGFLFWPIDTLFGPVVGWNLLLLTTIVLAGLFTYSWLRCLELGVLPALLGGLVFAIAPYRLEQSAGHLLGWAAVFLPLSLWAVERARSASTAGRAHVWGAVAAVALASISLSGQVHLALGAVPLLVAYAALRFARVPFAWTLGGALVAAGVGIAIRYALIAGSPEETGRSVDELRRYSAEPLDFLDRWHPPGSEEFVYLGWLTPALAVVGLVFLARRRRGLAVLFGVAASSRCCSRLGDEPARLRSSLAPLLAAPLHPRPRTIAADRQPRPGGARRLRLRGAAGPPGRAGDAVAATLVVLVALDLVVQPLSSAAADPDNGAYLALADSPPGRVLELPLFEPGVHYGSVYDYYQLQEVREQPGGYSTLAPQAAFDFYFGHDRLSCGVWLARDRHELARLGITRVLFHSGLYVQAARRGAWFAWRGLQEQGFGPVARGGPVTLFAPGAPAGPEPKGEPPRFRSIFVAAGRANA